MGLFSEQQVLAIYEQYLQCYADNENVSLSMVVVIHDKVKEIEQNYCSVEILCLSLTLV